MANKLNLIYAKSNSTFFSNITDLRSIISSGKKEEKTYTFTVKDETEIGRGRSYAFFDELEQEGITISTNSIRLGLSSRGITDTAFQNKILIMILQSKMGVQFPIGPALPKYLQTMQNQYTILLNRNWNIKLDVDSSDTVSLAMNFVYDLIDEHTADRTPMVEACIKINITLGDVVIDDFSLTMLSESPVATEIYNHLEENQQNILMKIITFILHALGFNDELILEKSEPEERGWGRPSTFGTNS